MFDHSHYVPILKGKAGEYNSLRDLASRFKSKLTPLIEIPPIPWDYDSGGPLKTIDEHLSKTVENILSAWGGEKRPLFIDLCFIDAEERMLGGEHPLIFLIEEAKQKDLLLIPVTGLDRDAAYQSAVISTVPINDMGVCVRIEGDDFSDTLDDDLNRLIHSFGMSASKMDLIIDLKSIPNDQVRLLSRTVIDIINSLPQLSDWRTITVASSSFPENLSEFEKNTENRVSRAEWMIYQQVASSIKIRRKPTYGDYTVVHPQPFEMDPRIMQQGAKVKYTSGDEFIIVKGQSIKRAGSEQTRSLCRHITALPEFSGADFSWGDNYIDECAKSTVGPGNQTTWVRVGVNHHLAFVVEQLASFHAP